MKINQNGGFAKSRAEQNRAAVEEDRVLPKDSKAAAEPAAETFALSPDLIDDVVASLGLDPQPVEVQTIQIGDLSFPVPEQSKDTAQNMDSNNDGVLETREVGEYYQGSLEDLGLNCNISDYAKTEAYHLAGAKPDYLNAYLSSRQISQKLAELEENHRDRAELVVLGKSTEGRDIQALRVSKDVRSEASKSRPSVIITGGLHSREWATHESVLKAADKFLAGDSPCLESLEVWFVPNSNPDGLEFSRNGNSMWRKNTWRDETGEIKGVDLNRNSSFNFRPEGDTAESTDDDIGGSDDVNAVTFRGPSPDSEPELRALKALLDAETNALGHLDVHSFGELLLIPGSKLGASDKEYRELAQAINIGMKDVDYRIQDSADLYPTSGVLNDYADSLGMSALTMEIGTSFQPDPSGLESLLDNASDGILAFVEHLGKKNSAVNRP